MFLNILRRLAPLVPLLCLVAVASQDTRRCEDDRTTLLQLHSQHIDRAPVSPSTSLPASSPIPLQLLMTGKQKSVDALPADVQSNINSVLASSPGLRLRYFDDSACRRYLEKWNGHEFVTLFDKEKHGSFRGDMCRSAILLREGGFYMDLDFQLRVPVHSLVDENTTFMSVLSHSQGTAGAHPQILNALIGVRPNNTLMRQTMDDIKSWYDSREGLLGPAAMTQAITDLVADSCPPKDALKGVLQDSGGQWACGSEIVRLYLEEPLDCNVDSPSVSCPFERAAMSLLFPGSKMGVFTSGSESQEARIVGWPRFAMCGELGCGLNGGLTS